MTPTLNLGPARVALALGVLGLIAPGCTPDRRRITPTTSGSDLRHLPRGRMSPQPLPGTDLVHRDGRPRVDSAALRASGPSDAGSAR